MIFHLLVSARPAVTDQLRRMYIVVLTKQVRWMKQGWMQFSIQGLSSSSRPDFASHVVVGGAIS